MFYRRVLSPLEGGHRRRGGGSTVGRPMNQSNGRGLRCVRFSKERANANNGGGSQVDIGTTKGRERESERAGLGILHCFSSRPASNEGNIASYLSRLGSSPLPSRWNGFENAVPSFCSVAREFRNSPSHLSSWLRASSN